MNTPSQHAAEKIDHAAQKVIGFASHDDDCEIGEELWGDVECTCGYTEAVNELRAALAALEENSDAP